MGDQPHLLFLAVMVAMWVVDGGCLGCSAHCAHLGKAPRHRGDKATSLDRTSTSTSTPGMEVDVDYGLDSLD